MQNFSAQAMGADGLGKSVGIVSKGAGEIIRMKITLIRHGKVNMKWKKWYTSEQFDRDCAKYDISPICSIDDKPEGLRGEIYISTLQRSFQTDCILISHGFFMRTLIAELRRQGFCIGKNGLSIANLVQITAEKSIKEKQDDF